MISLYVTCASICNFRENKLLLLLSTLGLNLIHVSETTSPLDVNSSPPSAAYMRQWLGSGGGGVKVRYRLKVSDGDIVKTHNYDNGQNVFHSAGRIRVFVTDIIPITSLLKMHVL